VSRFGLALVLILAPGLAAGQPPHVENGRLERQPAAPSLEATFRRLSSAARSPAWIGYEVPASASHESCCYGSLREIGPCAGCRIESMCPFRFQTAGAARVALEGAPRLVVLARVEAGRVDRMETLSPSCAIDLDGRTLHWIEGVAPAESPALLAGLAGAGGSGEEVLEGAMGAIALHAGREADLLLINQARRGASGEERGQALSWLAERAGDEAVKAIRAAIEDDPEREVKLQAVFALSELPDRAGVPLLIEIARTHRNPDVRREAFFWLGEAEDPRALAFFEAILVGPRARR
jgi:hypothetical protein